MAELKTKMTGASVRDFLAGIEDEQKRRDAQALVKMMQKATGAPAKMWGSAIIGFGDYHYKYASGRAGDWFIMGLSPRKAALTLYVMDNLENYRDLFARIGKYTTGKGCLYIKKLADVDTQVLEDFFARAAQEIKRKK